MSAEGKRNSSENENMCVVCFKNVEIYSIGICDHPVCFECSTRMRVLCRQNECPICRQDLPKVIFCYNVQPFRNLKAQHLNPHLVDHKFGIWFESPDFQKAYYQLLDHNCKKCDKYNPFRNFAQLKDHMRKDHELHYCDLCVTNLRIFTWERRCYTRSELAQHRRKGDTDNTSHRGHPLCEFCDTRYMDSDELFRHLRRDHLFCHFCDADGFHHYYPSYECLRQHFDSEHYLCEEGDCINEKFTSVFRTVIDLKAHRASVHGKHLSKAASKQARTLELEFTLKPRPRPELVSNRSNRKPQAPSVTNSNSERERFEEIEGAVGYEPYYTEPGGSRGATLTAQDFPTLGGSGTTAPALRAPSGNITIRQITRGQKGLVKTNDNFPALSGDSSTVRFSVNSSTTTVDSRERIQATTTTTSAPNVSIHVNHRPNGAITTHISQTTSNSVRVRPRPDAFPALGGSAIVQAAQWVKQTSPKEPKPKVSKVTPAPLLPLRDSATDFPTLSNNKIEQKLKKSSLVNVPVSNTWVSEQAEPHTTTESKNNKSKKKKTKNTTSNHQNNNNSNSNNNNSSEKNPNQNKTISASVTKSKENKKEPKNESQEDYKNDVKQQQLPVKQQQNGVKKRSELKIDSLHISDPSTSNGHDDFPSLSVSKSKPPPGFAAVQAPPGFAANDLTFTNSSGQSYSILPAQEFSPPPNFTQRNQNLVESFKRALKADDAMAEFRTLSGMFRNNLFASEEYYNHCKQVMRNDFSNIFPELLVLLPNIEKQQELYTIHCKDSANKRGLDVCATCNQIVSTSDLRSHLATHSLQNHFPALGSQDLSTVWRK